MTDGALPLPASRPFAGELERLWPAGGRAMPPVCLGLASAAGLSAALVLPTSTPGVGLFGVGLLVASATLPQLRGRLGQHELLYGALATLLLGVVVLRDADWLVALCLLGTVAAASYALCGGRTILGTLLGCMSLPLAGLRALPWIGRGLTAHLPTARRSWGPAVRAVAVGTALLLVFGSLFASADAVFAALLPSVDLDELPARAVIFLVFAGASLAAAFLASAPPKWDVVAPGRGRSVRPVEWIVPIAGLVALFALFVGVQVTAVVGGGDYVQRTAGLTYAEHARSGFGQLVVVTLLTLGVVGSATRWAPRETVAQRRLLRLLLGALCVLALSVVASALHRLHLYEEAFGFTQLRLFMNVFEGWLGLLIVLVLLAGVRLHATWLPGAVVASAAAALLGLAAINADGFVADRNVVRYEATGKLDTAYLQALSADAVPAIDRLPEPLRSCVLGGLVVNEDDGPGGWNFGRERAREIQPARSAAGAATCMP